MFEILVNNSVVAIAAENVVKIFVNALIDKLPIEFTVSTRRYNPQPVDNSDVKSE